MICALGAMLWTMLGIMQRGLLLGQGVWLPVWGIFEIIGGIGYSVATVRRARDPGLHSGA